MRNERVQWEYLKRSFAKDRIAHAYLFAGNDENEKAETAHSFIQLLHCAAPAESGRACGQCEQCRAINTGSHPDHSVLALQEDADEIKIGAIRDLHSRVLLTPHISRFKTALINNADAMNHIAQSAFLKLLEEPKGDTVFILLSKHPAFLLPTITSRAQPLSFYRATVSFNSNADLQTEIVRLSTASLAERFAFAKRMALSKARVSEALFIILSHYRTLLMQELAKPSSAQETVRGLTRFLNLTQETVNISARTNVNQRTALERVLIELPS